MISALAILAATPVTVVKPPEVRISEETDSGAASWQILDEVLENVERNHALKSGTTILRQRLVPKRLAVTKGLVERADGKDRWAKAGEQLFGVRVGDYDAFCSLKTKTNITVGMFLAPKTDKLLKQNCFVDTDGDGKLDRRFFVNPGIGVLPNVARSAPESFQELTPVEFEVLDPREFEGDSWVEIQFRGGKPNGTKPPKFRIRYRYDGKTKSLSDHYFGQKSGYPQSIRILGAELNVLDGGGNKLSAEIKSPMRGEFGVIANLKYR